MTRATHRRAACLHTGQKIGVVGRTGAGKSSLCASIIRLVEPHMGDIQIDGVSVLKMGLKDLRGSLTTIGQDPLFFSGTVRKNMDPFGDFDDVAITEVWWRSVALRPAHCVPAVVTLRTGPAGVAAGGAGRVRGVAAGAGL